MKTLPLLALCLPAGLSACQTAAPATSAPDGADSPELRVGRPAAEQVAQLEALGTDGDGVLQLYAGRGDESVRVSAVTALGRLDFPEHGADTTAPLAHALSDPSPAVRAAAAFGLGMRADPATGEVLLERWNDPDPTVRARLVEAASRLSSPRIRTEALYGLRDTDTRVRHAAAIAPHRWDTDDEDAAVVDRALVDAIQGETDAPDVELVWRVLFTLARRTSETGRPLFLEYASHRDVRARIFATKGLANLETPYDHDGFEVAREALVAALGDTDWRVAAEAALGLGKIPVQSSIAPLARALAHPSPHVRRNAAEALGSFERWKGEVLPQLGTALDNPSPSVRAAALVAGAELDGAGWTRRVADQASSPDAVVRAGAARAASHLPGDAAVALLARMTGDNDARVRWFATLALGEHDTDDAHQRLRELLAADDNGLKLAAISAIGDAVVEADLVWLERAFTSARGDISNEVAFEALGCAANLEGEAATALLRRGLDHPNAYVRATARELLVERGARVPDEEPSLPTEPTVEVDWLWPADQRNPVVEIETTRGTMVFELLANETPRHVRNFLALARRGHYDGLGFHRVVPDFVIQGGDVRGDGNGGTTWNGLPLRRELTAREYARGALGMPRNSDPDSGGSQIFVTHRPTPHLDGRYALFGVMIEGSEALDAIEVGDRILAVRER